MYSLYTPSVFSPYNYIFHFDRQEAQKLKDFGIKHIYHMPLAINAQRLQQTDFPFGHPMKYDVSFIGSLKEKDTAFFDSINTLPDFYQGYLDALMKAQMNIFGYNLLTKVLTPKEYQKFSSFFNFQNDGQLFLENRDLFLGILEKKISNTERLELLQALSKYFKTTLFSASANADLQNIEFKGYVNYLTEMPYIFRDSKINLNITHRSIHSGIPLRCLDILGAGGFLISNYQPELAEFFENKTELIMYESKEDLLYKTDYYLNHEKERIEIAHNGMEKVRKEFDYKIMVEKIIKEISKTNSIN